MKPYVLSGPLLPGLSSKQTEYFIPAIAFAQSKLPPLDGPKKKAGEPIS